MQLQVSEGTAVRRLEEAQKKNTKLEALVLRLEQRVDEKDQTIYHNKAESKNKANHLKRNLQVSVYSLRIDKKVAGDRVGIAI